MSREPSGRAGSGERIERSRRLRRWLSQGVAGAIGIAMGMALVARTHDEAVSLSPAVAIALAIAFVLFIAGATIVHHRITDEVEIRETHQAAMGGVYTYMIGYPVWWLLWVGNVAPEPDHELLFLAFCVGVTASFLYHRFR